ncbi:type II toxin-antitoxin system VapC family toxin [Tunturibacter empetritectus]|uniref:Type II toxin-antitoxin system VapC family toxin n=1 Tax=Tunturiibacter empetritectus TaxID=3069691 RepID=A0AAU7ZGN2_9BACT
MTGRSRYLLDTNVLSETRKKRPDERVLAFLSNAAPTALYLSCLSVGELRKGVALKRNSDPSAAKAIAGWVDGLEMNFADRILSVDTASAKLWGEWSVQRPRPVIDTLLAATAVVHGLVFVTRNESDVQDLPIKLLNPWRSDS